jgi:hypothetical protein
MCWREFHGEHSVTQVRIFTTQPSDGPLGAGRARMFQGASSSNSLLRHGRKIRMDPDAPPTGWCVGIWVFRSPPNLNQPWMKYPEAVGPSPVSRAPAPSPAMTCLKPPIIPLLYLTGSSCMRVLTTSTGVRAPGASPGQHRFDIPLPCAAAGTGLDPRAQHFRTRIALQRGRGQRKGGGAPGVCKGEGL